MKIAIIGAGISGLSMANFLKSDAEVVVFEKASQPGGLIRCERINGSLFHLCGGHVFNTKRRDVLDWFWTMFNADESFVKANRNSVVFMEDGNMIPYPIENHIYMLNHNSQINVIRDFLSIEGGAKCDNFEGFLKSRFGETLYQIYFRPYNEKIWKRDLSEIPLSWLDGKLPMPTIEEMIFNNINRIEEMSFVHSSFWYAKNDGSQFIINKLSDGLNIIYNVNTIIIERKELSWIVNGMEFEKVVYCGNIKDLPKVIKGIHLEGYISDIEALGYHGTTTAFCEIDKVPYSWIYQPSRSHKSHRIICTGNFAESNNSTNIPPNRMTSTVEFTDEVTKDMIVDDLRKMPFNPKYITHRFSKYTYPIQNQSTRDMIRHLKDTLSQQGFYITGRFADWEYYNMDAAIGASIDTYNKMCHSR